MIGKSALIFVFLLFGFFAFSGARGFAQTKSVSADEILQKTSDNLANLKILEYSYRRELNYASEGYFNELKANIYLDFTSVDKIIGMRYQFSGDTFLFVFNGSERFDLNKKEKTIKVDSKPTADDFSSSSFFYDSPVTLKKALPAIIADKTIQKTVTDEKDFYTVEFVLDKKSINHLGSISPLSTDRKTIYRLKIGKNDFLPIEVFHGNNLNKDFTRTSFGNLETKPAAPAENSWYYSTYLNEYKYAKPLEDSLIKPALPAPDWKLPVFETNAQISLGQYKNKVVMLEFWISFCGYCIAAVPKLNALEEKFKNKDFKLIGINANDSPEIVGIFKKNNRPNYQILYDGETAAKSYGVTAFPTIILIDKTGKVIYAGTFQTDKIEEILAKNL